MSPVCRPLWSLTSGRSTPPAPETPKSSDLDHHFWTIVFWTIVGVTPQAHRYMRGADVPYGASMPHPMTHEMYAEHSDFQLRGAELEAELIAGAALEIPPTDSVVIADYGCAQGRVSADVLVRVAVDTIRSMRSDVPIFVYHNDLLSNDWTTLFDRLRDERSYVHAPGGPTTPLVSATSFFTPVTPPGIVDLGLSFAAAQWLAEPGPTDGGTALYFDQLAIGARMRMADQAAADWRRFLQLRRDELAPGGRLLVNVMGTVDGEPSAGHDLWCIVRDVCLRMAADGMLDPARLDTYVVPVYERAVDEVRRPFESAGLGLELEELEVRRVGNPASDRYRANGDAQVFGQTMTGFFRAWSEPSMRAGLALDDAAAQRLYGDVESRIATEADDFEFGLHTITALVTKVG